MKRQTGFISSSSSVSVEYTTSSKVVSQDVSWSNVHIENEKYVVKNWTGAKFSTRSQLNNSTTAQQAQWSTYESEAYARIEYFLEAVEKVNEPYTRSTKFYYPLYDFAHYIDKKDIYNGFIDIVITFPIKIRLAGIELLNPWVDKLSSDNPNNWRYLPSKFSIFKVNDDLVNDALEHLTYENDVAAKTNYDKTKTSFRPVKYNSTTSDNNLIFLGTYEVDWENTASYECFFKFNANDNASINASDPNADNAGTATWECKQLVLRIFKTKMSEQQIDQNVIKQKICEYIATKETEYGTTYFNNPPTADDIADKWSFFTTSTKIFKGMSLAEYMYGWSIGSAATRKYNKVGDIFFSAGMEYKIGGIQLLLSPDIFSISEMKMFNYSNSTNNKVFIGEWNKDTQNLIYYGTGTLKTSDLFDISNITTPSITWYHGFNIPPKYLDVKVFAKFKVDFGSFMAGDVITNLVNLEKEPLSMRLTGTTVTLNISRGVCFTNPETGEFMEFKGGEGISMDTEGNYDALYAAMAVNANIVDAGSRVAARIEQSNKYSDGKTYPFDLYFTVKRLF